MQLVLVEKQAGYAILTLNDPDHRNVFSLAMSAQVRAAFDELEADDSMRCVVLTGAGKGFCAGGHLDELLENKTRDRLWNIYEGFLRIAESRLATIAAVNGAAVGAGLNAALACDVVVAAESARFDARFLQIAIGPGGGNTWRLRNLANLQTVNAMVLFGEILRGAEAAQAGLAWKCVSDEQLLPSAVELAERAAVVPRELLVRTKDTIARSASINDIRAAVENEIDTQEWSMQQPEFQATVAELRRKISGRAAE